MTPVLLVCAVFLTIGFAIKHAPSRHPRSIHKHKKPKGWFYE